MVRSITYPVLFSVLATLASAQYTATYKWGQLPAKTEGDGQSGTNACGTQSSQSSMCQNVVVNSANDFCIWGPPDDSKRPIGTIEEVVVAYCLNEGYGTRLLPSGTITDAHFVRVMSDKVSYVQVTGNGDFTKIGLPAGDDGGELDPHSWTGLGNPQGGLVFTNAFTGQYEQTHEWTSFQSASNFCIRACRDGPNASKWCEHIYDVLGCGFTIPGSFDAGFDDCNGDPAEQPGVYSGSTFHQDDPTTPAPHPAGPTSQCRSFNSVGGGNAAAAATLLPSITGSASSASASSSRSASGSMSNSTSVSSTSVSNSSSVSMTSTSMSASMTSSGMTTSRTGVSSTASVVGAAVSASASASQAAGSKVVAGGVGIMGALGAFVAALL
ncbi:uncharacterized protein MKK02DRAFT_20878 [Dioszegia hungarica]|uniref:Macrofage activating glycoprotein n=1 Tax=Dioszegia hungarica TaxID=4972 RepID=A0AA38H1T9_9TREE|nr:uncharacterized protein MKK02DRAFT_20878 [Dioszegia hungarica]KAI9632150.1 hypothetical protein MKK02DRAFT_20878 [Dioszegia hungarica]